MTKAKLKDADIPFGLSKLDPHSVVFTVSGRTDIAIKAGTSINHAGVTSTLAEALPVLLDNPVAGLDYTVLFGLDGEKLRAIAMPADMDADSTYVEIGGFHFAPGGNANGVAGGDDIPAINPFSCWDRNFRPACPSPRGMALIDNAFWADIYLTSAAPALGTSRYGVTIADGNSLPEGHRRFDYAAAVAVLAAAGKQLLGAEEFFAATYGVTERSSADRDPKITALDAPRTSRHGIMQATGNMWTWGTDGHPDDPRASIFGGSWFSGSLAGSRYASLDNWPENSVINVGARGRSDHLVLA
jgi:Nitric oxide synthase, oxygenase domain